MVRLTLIAMALAGMAMAQFTPPSGSGGSIPKVTNVLSGDGSGNAVDSGLAAGALMTNVTACGGNLSGTFPNCNAPVTTPGYSPNQTLSGCGVEYTTGLHVTVGVCSYAISGVSYSSPLANLTFATADSTNPRIDLVIVDNTSTASILQGTAAASPVAPATDPSTQLPITFVYIAAGATAPANVTANQIFFNGSEWTQSYTAHIALTTNNPYSTATHSIEATSAVLNNNVQLVDPASGTVNMATVNSLTLYVRSKGQWPTGASGATAARYLNIFWLNGSTQKGTAVVLRDGAFGFVSSNTTSYQQITIPSSAFGINGIPVTTLEIAVSGNSGSSSIGFYIGDITLQAGAGNTSLPATLVNFRGTWSSSTGYNANDEVVYNGLGYVALSANTNVTPTTAATWATLSSTIRAIGASFGAFQSGATALSGSLTSCTPVYYSGTILGVEVISDVSGSVTVDVKTVAHSSWTGTSSASSITASAIPALSSAARYTDTTLTGWTKAVTAGTDFCFVLTSPTTVAGVGIALQVAVTN